MVKHSADCQKSEEFFILFFLKEMRLSINGYNVFFNIGVGPSFFNAQKCKIYNHNIDLFLLFHHFKLLRSCSADINHNIKMLAFIAAFSPLVQGQREESEDK